VTTPAGRISFGYHAFPFYGLAGDGPPLPSLPMVPIRIRSGATQWSNPLNAVPDTGSTHSYVPRTVAVELGVHPGGEAEPRQGGGGTFSAAPAVCDIAIVNAYFPSVACWELAKFTVWIPARDQDLDYLLLGWDLLHLFDVSFSHHENVIQMRLAPERRP
jgi:hypothetical protein